MVVDGPFRHDQALGDLGVAQALGQQRQHFELARRQANGVLARGGARAPGQAAHAAVAQPPREDRSRGPGSEAVELFQSLAQRGVIVGVGER